MAAQNVPAAEIDITEPLVRALLAEQHPDLADHPLTFVANGWDNAIVRVGHDLLARLPRRQLGADLVEHEQRWLPGLVDRLPLPIPAPVRVGRPSATFPWAWSICPWFEGEVAADVPLADPGREAARLGSFVAALHAVPADGAPANPHRGQPMAELRSRVETNLGRLGDDDAPDVMAVFDRFASVPDWSGPPVLLHGDLHTANVLVVGGTIGAVLDFGDLTSGDPAVDLAIGWMLFDGDDLSAFRRAAGGGEPIGDDTWSRAQAWAVHFAVVYLLHSADSERFARMGTALLTATLRAG